MRPFGQSEASLLPTSGKQKVGGGDLRLADGVVSFYTEAPGRFELPETFRSGQLTDQVVPHGSAPERLFYQRL